MKVFTFQFVNSYAPLIYIALFKPFFVSIDPCVGSCLSELAFTLGGIFLFRLLYLNTVDIFIPWYQSYVLRAKVEKTYRDVTFLLASAESSHSGHLTDIEFSYMLPECTMLTAVDSYAQMVIQFGYATLFVAAFPLAPIIAFISNYVQIRMACWKFCHVFRRPEPRCFFACVYFCIAHLFKC